MDGERRVQPRQFTLALDLAPQASQTLKWRRLSVTMWVSGLPQTGQVTLSAMYRLKSWTKDALSFLPMKMALSASSEAAVASSFARYIRSLSGSLLISLGYSE